MSKLWAGLAEFCKAAQPVFVVFGIIFAVISGACLTFSHFAAEKVRTYILGQIQFGSPVTVNNGGTITAASDGFVCGFVASAGGEPFTVQATVENGTPNPDPIFKAESAGSKISNPISATPTNVPVFFIVRKDQKFRVESKEIHASEDFHVKWYPFVPLPDAR